MEDRFLDMARPSSEEAVTAAVTKVGLPVDEPNGGALTRLLMALYLMQLRQRSPP